MKQAPLFGLVLAGGHSTRMGTDKATLEVHGQCQLSWTADLLAPFCRAVMASVRLDQMQSLGQQKLQLIPDKIPDSGPLAGILAALQLKPDHAWLVVACDMPWLDTATLAQLMAGRDSDKVVTVFKGSQGPEPLCSIWEPGALAPLTRAMNAGQRSVRRILEQLPLNQLDPTDPKTLLSINTPELLAQARRDLSRRPSGNDKR